MRKHGANVKIINESVDVDKDLYVDLQGGTT